MHTIESFAGLPRCLVAAVPSRILSPARKAWLEQWLLRTFPATKDGLSRLFITLTALISLPATFAAHALAYSLHPALGYIALESYT